jgi:hypothetical protein
VCEPEASFLRDLRLSDNLYFTNQTFGTPESPPRVDARGFDSEMRTT